MFALSSQVKKSIASAMTVLFVGLSVAACSSGQHEFPIREDYVPLHDHGIKVADDECPTVDQLIEADAYIWQNDVLAANNRTSIDSAAFAEVVAELGDACSTFVMTGQVKQVESEPNGALIFKNFCSAYEDRHWAVIHTYLEDKYVHNLSLAAYLKDPTLYFTGLQCQPGPYEVITSNSWSLWAQTEEGKAWFQKNQPEDMDRIENTMGVHGEVLY